MSTRDSDAAVAIAVRGLVKRFGPATALDGIDLEIRAGEMFGLIGPNGAGKTTLLRILATLLAPTAGTVTVLGRDVVRQAAGLLPRIGFVSQEFSLYASLTVGENLEFFADLYRVPRRIREARTRELLAWSRLTPFRDRPAGKLSGGMQKKLHLCSALIHEPEVLLLDEPTAGVDPVSRRELWEILHDLVARGLTLVVATAYMDEAEQCRRVALVHRGRILACDAPEVLRHAAPETVWEVRAPSLHEAYRRLQGARLPGRPHLMGDRLHVLVPPRADVAESRAALTRVAGGGAGVRQVEPTTEDVFVSLVSRAEPPAPRRADGLG